MNALTIWRPQVNTIYNMDALAYLRQCESDSVHCMITSPPYWGLRSYLEDDHPDKDTEIGLEETLEEFLQRLVVLFREARRVLHPSGTLWCNMGDSYASGGNHAMSNSHHSGDIFKSDGYSDAFRNSSKYQTQPSPNTTGNGLKPKDLIGQPWRLALALQADGWWLRSDIIWAKSNPMPESVTDRPTKSHEHVFLLTKQPRYFYDAEAVREPHKEPWRSGTKENRNNSVTNGDFLQSGYSKKKGGFEDYWTGVREYNPAGRNKRDVWRIATQAMPDAHFATFPEKLVEPCLLAGCPPKVCAECGMPWERVVEPTEEYKKLLAKRSGNEDYKSGGLLRGSKFASATPGLSKHNITTGWQPQCECGTDTIPGIVLDMFMGSGTVAKVATQHGRRWQGCELNSEYIAIAERRLSKGIPVDMFTAAGILVNS